MNPKKAARMWVELSMGERPKELKNVKLDTHEEIWTEMEKLRPLASKAEVNRIWAQRQGLTHSDVAMNFGCP